MALRVPEKGETRLAREPLLICLAYPCREATWASLRERGRLFHRASVPAMGRRIELMLAAFPLATKILPEASEVVAREVIRMAS